MIIRKDQIGRAGQAVGLLLALLVFTPCAFATSYTLNQGGFGFTLWHENRTEEINYNFNFQQDRFRATFNFNPVTDSGRIRIRGIGQVRERIYNPDTGRYEMGDVTVRVTPAVVSLDYENLTELGNDELAGLESNGATGSGSITVYNMGDIAGDSRVDPLRFEVEARQMDFSRYAGTNDYHSLFADLGRTNFSFVETGEFFGGGLGAFSWLRSLNETIRISYLGNNHPYAFATADMGVYQEPVPEPATAVLFGAGLLGTMYRRKNKL